MEEKCSQKYSTGENLKVGKIVEKICCWCKIVCRKELYNKFYGLKCDKFKITTFFKLKNSFD